MLKAKDVPYPTIKYCGPVSVEDVLAALAGGHYKTSVYSEYMFIRPCDDCHLAYIATEELQPEEDEISVDVCGQHYKSTLYTNHWFAADTNTIPNDPRLAEALCNIREYKDVTLEGYLDLNYTRSEIEHQIAGYGTEIYFDFAAPPGCNIVVRPRTADLELFTQWNELKARHYIKITLDQAVDFLYTNRHEFNLAKTPRKDNRPEEIPEPQLTTEPPAPAPADTPF